jgi:hypothetical protein
MLKKKFLEENIRIINDSDTKNNSDQKKEQNSKIKKHTRRKFFVM